MKTFQLIYKNDLPYLREKNPLAGTSLVSALVYAEHENLYIESALLLLNGIPGRQHYNENELAVYWRHNGVKISGDPAFIDSRPEEYDHVFEVIASVVDYQERVKLWLFQCFGEDVARDKAERAFRFMEEALELVQAIGLSREDVYRCVAYTYSRPVGEINQEIGGVGFTLAALCFASGLNLVEAMETEIENNWQRKDDIIEKRKNKVTVNPIIS